MTADLVGLVALAAVANLAAGYAAGRILVRPGPWLPAFQLSLSLRLDQLRELLADVRALAPARWGRRGAAPTDAHPDGAGSPPAREPDAAATPAPPHEPPANEPPANESPADESPADESPADESEDQRRAATWETLEQLVRTQAGFERRIAELAESAGSGGNEQPEDEEAAGGWVDDLANAASDRAEQLEQWVARVRRLRLRWPETAGFCRQIEAGLIALAVRLAGKAAQLRQASRRDGWSLDFDPLTGVLAACHAARKRLEQPLAGLAHQQGLGRRAAEELGGPSGNCWTGRMEFDALLGQLRREADEEHASCGVVVIDIDSLSELNARFGPALVDRMLEALQRVVARVGDGCRQTMLGNRELVLVAPDADADDAALLAERIRQTVEQTRFEQDGQTICVTVSAAAGAAPLDQPGEMVLERLLATLEEAKSCGRNRTCVLKDSGPEFAPRRKLDVPAETVSA